MFFTPKTEDWLAGSCDWLQKASALSKYGDSGKEIQEERGQRGTRKHMGAARAGVRATPPPWLLSVGFGLSEKKIQ